MRESSSAMSTVSLADVLLSPPLLPLPVPSCEAPAAMPMLLSRGPAARPPAPRVWRGHGKDG
jgi:hypothetical protein